MQPVVKREQIAAGYWVVRPLLEPPVAPPSAEEPAAAPPPEAEALAAGDNDPLVRQRRLLSALAASLVRERGRQLGELRPELLKLVLAICRELLGREVATPPSVIEHTLAAALKMLNGAGGIVAHVNPEDAELLERQWADLPAHEWPGHLKLVPDSALGPGECRLESDRGAIEATWDAQLEAVRQALSQDVDGGLD